MTGSSTTSATSDEASGSADFVMISYPGADYLVNREEIISSVYHGGEIPRCESGVIGAMAYNQKTIPVLSLDDHLGLYFGERPAPDREVLLFVRGSGGAAPFPRIKKKSDGGEVDTSVIAVRASGAAEIVSLPLKELRPLPRGVRKGVAKHGLLAVRFPGAARRIQYFIDMKTVIILSILQHHNRQARNENPDR